MASHKQSFQCFDTITDDPPLKPSFPHGHCSARSFRDSSGSTRLEPLEDRACYLCVDHQQAKTMASGAYSNPWYHLQTHPHAQQYTNRRPFRPEEAPEQSEDHHHHHHHRHSRKIVLVKNSDPSVRRTIVLHRKSLCSLSLFMDEVSELMQCLIRKLYTLQGHKIDSVQSLLQCPSVLVCVGREPFHPLLLDSFRKNSYDKLPRLNIKPRSSVCSDEKGAKRNVNFGLETNRSVIHPKCDSSKRSGGPSTSSEKMFPNRLTNLPTNSLPPGHRGDCPHTGENMMDDDIEKRVLVNQDGSLSMEMKVRFRLLHNETLHWSTEVKKSKSSFNESHDDAYPFSHCSAESCSEADSISVGEEEETSSTKCYQRHFEEPHCQHCCAHCQEYGMWKNPVPPSQRSVRRIRSSSSSASSRRIVCKKASTDSMRTMSSEEYTEHLVEKATCIQQTIGQQGDTMIEECTINHCCSRSEVRSVSPKTKSTSGIEDKRENIQASDNDENRPDVISSNLPKDQFSVQITLPVEEDERPISVVSTSSQILASLKEDQDDEEVSLPPSISRASRGQQEDEESKDVEPSPCSVTPSKSPRPPSKALSSGQSKTSRRFASPEVGDKAARSEASASPKSLSGSKTCECVVSKDITTPGSFESNGQLEDMDVQDTETEERALSAMSAKSKMSTKSLSELSTPYENDQESTEVNDEIIEERCSSAISIKSNTSGKSNTTNLSKVQVQDGRAHSAMSIKSHRSDKSRNSEVSDNVSTEHNSEVRTSSAMSVKSNTSVRSKLSESCFDELAYLQDNVEERPVSAVSSESSICVKSIQSKETQSAPDGACEERIAEKASSVKSGTSNKSGIEDQIEERVHSSISTHSNISARSRMSIELSELEAEQDRAPSSVSIKSTVSQKSDISEAAYLQEGGECLNSVDASVQLNTPEAESATQVELPGERSPSSLSSISNISKRSRTSKISEADQDEAQENEDVQERASSTISVSSTISASSRKSKKTPIPGSGEEMKERVPSVLSIKSNASLKSKKSKMEEEETENRVSSALSVKSESKKSKGSGMVADIMADRDDLRSASVLSSKSNISAKSVKSMVSEKDQTEEREGAYSAQSNQSGVTVSDGVEIAEERALSAMSSKSNASERLKKSKNLKVPFALPGEAEHQTEERSQSALSARSSVSTRSNKSRISDVLTDEVVDAAEEEEEEKEERASSALSAKSNVSAKTKKSNVSGTDVNTHNKEKGDRVPSAMSEKSDISTKTSISAKSKASKVSELQTEEPDEKYQEERASSALSAKSNVSAKSKKSNVSETDVNTDNKEKGDRVPSAMSEKSDISTKTSISAKSKASKVLEVEAEEPDEKDQVEERASSALSAKSNVSAKSKKSNVSGTDVNTDNKEKGDRVPSAMSEKSDISTKTSISAKSKASKVSEVEAEEPDEKYQEERASSALSVKSNLSAKSKKSNMSGTDVNTNTKEKWDRLPSAMSEKSDISTKTSISAKSKASKVSEVRSEEPDDEESEVKSPSERSNKSNHLEEVQNLDRPPSGISLLSEATLDENEISNEEEIQERAPSAVSAKSNSSVRSRASRVSEIIIVEPNEQNVKRAPSSRSLKSVVSGRSGPEDPVNEDKLKEARTESALSSISNISARSNKSEDSKLTGNVQQRAQSTASVTSKTSTRSQRSNISGVVPKETENTDTGDVRSSSAMSAKSCASEKSKHSERTVEEDDEANELVERTSSLSVKSTPSTTSDAIVKSSVVPTKSNASAKSLLSEAEEPDGRSTSVVSNTSAESKVSKAGVDKKTNRSVSSDSERLLTPTSTSVSIGIVEDYEVDDVEEIDEGAVSMNSRTSGSSKTEICGRSDQCLTESTVPITTETTRTPEERPKSLASAKSNVSSKSKSNCSHCSSTFPRDPNQDKDDVASNKSSKTKNLDTSSANGSERQSTPTEEIRPSSKASGMSVHSEVTGQEKTGSPDVTHKSQSVCSKCSSTQQKRPISSASAKEGNAAEVIDRPKSNISSSSSHLKVNGQKNDVKTSVTVNGSNNKLSTRSIQKFEDNTPRGHSSTSSVTSGNHLSPIPPKSPRKSKKTVILLSGSNDSVLSQTVPALDPREEHTDCLNIAAEQSCKSDRNVSDIKSEKSSKCRKRIGSDSSGHKMDEDMSELSPSCLPNASPTEVVNEWLRKIPSDTTLCDLGDEFHENFDSIEPLCTSHVPSEDENKHETLRHGLTKLETQPEREDANVMNAEGVIDKKVAEGDHSQRGEEPKMFNSSVLVMKVLLSSKLNRCNSLPEVSHVYGRKLSTSAQGLLDCLANLQLLDFGSSDEDGKKEKYQELMSILKSLWLCDPTDSEKTSKERNNHLDKEFKARSSSGVDVNSGSTGSGKSSVNDGTQAQINTECEGLDNLTKVEEVDETVEEEASETPVSNDDSASQAQRTPETKDTVEEKLKDVRGSDETIRNNDSPRELIETPISSNKSSGNNNNETESDRQEDTSSSSAPTLQRGNFSKRLSQDPDPVWVLNLLNKLEKQFMTNYVAAMAEFKVRWNLDDNEQLDVMIRELQDEVRRRIQTSIDRELRKIQGRAGRPRPPKETMSRESTVQTEQKRRRLKVMRNQSIDPQPKSDDDNTMTGTDFSDQRSDDEYCPCDTCLKKKMASKQVLPVEMMNSAPVMMDFDLRRILQTKKSSPTNENIGGIPSESTVSKKEREHVVLQAVKEEDEKEGVNKEMFAPSDQEFKEDYEKQESEEGGEEDNASSTYEEDSSVKQAKIGEIAEMSNNTITAQHKGAEQDEEQEQNDETDSNEMSVKESESSSKINDELDEDVANDDISEFDDIMQAETAKEEAPEEYVEEESEELDETAYEEGETTGEDTVENRQNAKALAAEEHDIAGNETAEDGETAEGETVEDKTLDDGQTPEAETTREDKITEDETGEEGETVNDKTAEEDEVDEHFTAEDGQTAEDETGEEGETVNENTAKEHEVDENVTAEDGQTAEDETGEDKTAEEHEVDENDTAEDGQTAEDETAEEDKVEENFTAEDGQTAEDETGEEGETVNENTAKEHEVDENFTAEDGQTAEDETGEDKTAEEDEVDENDTAEDGQTAEDETGEEVEKGNNNSVEEDEEVENESADNEQTAEDETGEEVETGNYDTGEEHEAAENETAEDSETASKDGQTSEAETAGEDKITEDETAEEDETTAKSESLEDGQTAESETAGEDIITEDETAQEGETTAKIESVEDGQTAGEDDITEDETVEGETSANNESVENAEDETTEDGDTGDNQTAVKGETVNDDTVEECEMAENESVEDGQTAEAETAGETDTGDDDTADVGTAEAQTEVSEDKATVEDGTTAEDKNAELELAERKQTPDHETTVDERDKSQSDVEEVSCGAAKEEEDILSNPEDAEYLDNLTNLEVVEDETSLKNKGDVVLHSVDDNGEESETEDDGVEIIANKCGLVANIGESDEAGDEAEDDTEPDLETDEGEHDGNTPASQPVVEPKQMDEKPDGEALSNALVEFEDGADADGEDSETEELSQVVESEGKPQEKTPRKTFKMLVHAVNFLRLSATGQPERREECNEHEVEDEETREDESDDARGSSCVEKDKVEELNGNEKGKLSDITEDTAEEEQDQTNETNDDSKDSEWESSENALQKQMTKSSMESQPGSIEEVHEELTKNQNGLNHLKANP
ncbi:retinitis pigmentosa 1-like 1 protein [Pimephales promelas]|nr:retinitis pigmentosa 1-like 1 protein [Pimephales promelas]KAG1963617.1 retinitis pigmentosa 1-like 1 protein [Pimephales promelas]